MASDFEEIVSVLRAAYVAAYGDDSLGWSAFRLSEKEHGAMRRVLFIPTSFVSRSPTETGPRRSDDGTFYDAIGRETWTVECVIWGTDFADAERIRRRLVKICRDVFRKGSCRVVSGNWLSQASDEARHAYGGAEQLSVRFEWDLDIFAEDVAVTQVELEAIETQAKQAGVLAEEFEQPPPE